LISWYWTITGEAVETGAPAARLEISFIGKAGDADA
jgi:hypothetical protein